MFFLPLFDDNPPGRLPVVNWLIIAACVLVFLHQTSLSGRDEWQFMLDYAAVPRFISDRYNLPSLVTSAFLHGGWLHLGGNMLYLWIFGDNVEDRMGPVRFTLFYLLCAVAATLAHVAVAPSSQTPLVGASGAIAGVLAAYLILHPRAKVRVLVVILVFIRWIRMPAFVVLAAWALMQVLFAPASIGAEGGTAYFAHIGGFVAGLALTPMLARRKEAPEVAEEPPADQATHPVETATARQVRNEFAERYSYRRRSRRDTHVPGVRRPSQGRRPKGPWG